MIMLRNPNKPPDDDPSLANYHDILRRSKAIYHNNDDSTRRLKSSAGYKYTTFIKPVWGQKKGSSVTKGSGYRFYKDPNDLCDRLRLLTASREAGNTGLDEVIVHLLIELRRNALLSEEEYDRIVRGYAVC